MQVEYQIIKRKDNFCIDDKQFLSLLETNHNYKIIRSENKIKYKKLSIKYVIKHYVTNENDEIMFIICFSIDNEEELENFEKFDKSFVDFISKFSNDLTLNVLWDDISRKYAEFMYPKINYIENLLRKIIYYFMGKNVGNNWIHRCFQIKVGDSIKNVKEKNKNESDENILFYADFIQLSNLLFIKYSNELISQKELIEKIKEKDCNIKNLINRYEYKSNWERYFASIVNKENLNELYGYRNLVAHNRKIRKNDIDESEKLITKISKILQQCLDKIDDIKVPKEEKENLENISSKIFNTLPHEIGINPEYTSIIDSLRINFGTDSAFASAIDSAKINLGSNSALASAIDSTRLNLGINPELESALASAKIQTEKYTKQLKNMGSKD